MTNKKLFIKLISQVPHKEYQLGNTCKVTYSLQTTYTEVDESLSDCENLDKAIEIAVSHGADINKRVKWTTVTEDEYVSEVFLSIKDLIPSMCKCWGKKGKYGQNLYGDVLDWMKDNYTDLYRSSSCEILARLIIGEYVIKTSAL